MTWTDLPDFTFALLSLLPFLVAAMATDLRGRRIPNRLVVLMLCCGIVSQVFMAGWSALPWSLGGVAVGFLMLLPFYLLGGMAAGDVKLLAGVGSFVGPMGTLHAGAYTLLAGGVLAVLWIIARRIAEHATRKRVALTSPYVTNDSRATGERVDMPYSLAISAGTFMAVLQW